MKEHELSKLLPKMTADEYSNLLADIKANGQCEPITLFQGAILDGRHRWRACAELKIKPITKEFSGTADEARAFVMSENLHRRHLTTKQRADIAADMVTTSKGGDRQEQSAEMHFDISRAAKLAKVSVRTVKQVRKIRANGTVKLKAAVDNGKLSVSRAAQIAAMPVAVQNNPAKWRPTPGPSGKFKAKLLRDIEYWFAHDRHAVMTPRDTVDCVIELINKYEF